MAGFGNGVDRPPSAHRMPSGRPGGAAELTAVAVQFQFPKSTALQLAGMALLAFAAATFLAFDILTDPRPLLPSSWWLLLLILFYLIGGIFLLLPLLRLQRYRVEVTDSGISQPGASPPRMVHWSEIREIKEPKYLRCLELIGNGENRVRLEFQLADFDRLLRIVMQKTARLRVHLPLPRSFTARGQFLAAAVTLVSAAALIAMSYWAWISGHRAVAAPIFALTMAFAIWEEARKLRSATIDKAGIRLSSLTRTRTISHDKITGVWLGLRYLGTNRVLDVWLSLRDGERTSIRPVGAAPFDLYLAAKQGWGRSDSPEVAAQEVKAARIRWSQVLAVGIAGGIGAFLGGTLMRTPIRVDKVELLSLLDRRDFAVLERRLQYFQERAEKDIRREVDTRMAFETFFTDLEIKPVLDDWLGANRDSYCAHTATAEFLSAAGYQARGSAFAEHTSKEQFDAMEHFLWPAVNEANVALVLNPKALEAYRILMEADMFLSRDSDFRSVAGTALNHYPASFVIRREIMRHLEPRWGGSNEQMAEFATRSQRYAGDNPRLRVLKGWVAYDQARMFYAGRNYSACVAFANRALELGGDYSEYYRKGGDCLFYLGDYKGALEDLNRADRLVPQSTETLFMRAFALEHLRMHQQALNDIQLLSKLKKPDDEIEHLRNWIEQEVRNSSH